MSCWLKVTALPALATASLIGLSACYQEPKATIFEPGVYKGAADPLVQLERSPEQQQRLRQRFELVQTDR